MKITVSRGYLRKLIAKVTQSLRDPYEAPPHIENDQRRGPGGRQDHLVQVPLGRSPPRRNQPELCDRLGQAHLHVRATPTIGQADRQEQRRV